MGSSRRTLYNANKIDSGMPIYTRGEEILNAATHGAGLLASIVGAIFLIIASFKSASPLFCCVVYVVTLFLLYTSSTIYHILSPFRKIKLLFRKIDHCSIFLFIAGSYTPISILLIKGLVAVCFVVVVWLTAILGVILNLFSVNRFAKLSLMLYIAMGWVAILLIGPIVENSSGFQTMMLLSGGIAYTVGAVVYVLGKKIKYMHSVWHLFVLLGSILHFLLIYSLYLNPK
ncbi:MAG: hemolysin III family protein [Oscillospiraceae bacterium]|nr:hemolysin III family protein [Oscillospiraceae bacterium]